MNIEVNNKGCVDTFTYNLVGLYYKQSDKFYTTYQW